MANLTKLEQHLASRSYVEGYTASQADVKVFKAISSAPSAESNPHVVRWYAHIKSYTSEFASLAGSSTAGEAFLGASSAPAPDDDEVDLFGSDDEDDAEAERLKAERVAEYTKKKAGKPKTVAKSIVILDVKPWDDETDMNKLLEAVKSIKQDGLVWGGHQFLPIGYEYFHFMRSNTSLATEDELVSVAELEEKITEFEDYVQSTDVAAMQSTSTNVFNFNAIS
ncbi:elongation factor 1 beta/delta chain [Mycena olivaceomarginata]|nr:elongation factor 1 beta/delta chain [Mycena olivaceomarginata]